MKLNFFSGLFTTYTTLKYTNGKYEYLNKIGFLLSRFIRLTPQLAIFILLTSLMQLMGSGPVWNQQIMPKINDCEKYWWQNLIYIQNLINPQNMVIDSIYSIYFI
jgi:peptidoglycan/LPS O-acetylase OafA/YrhL